MLFGIAGVLRAVFRDFFRFEEVAFRTTTILLSREEQPRRLVSSTYLCIHVDLGEDAKTRAIVALLSFTALAVWREPQRKATVVVMGFGGRLGLSRLLQPSIRKTGCALRDRFDLGSFRYFTIPRQRSWKRLKRRRTDAPGGRKRASGGEER